MINSNELKKIDQKKSILNNIINVYMILSMKKNVHKLYCDQLIMTFTCTQSQRSHYRNLMIREIILIILKVKVNRWFFRITCQTLC